MNVRILRHLKEELGWTIDKWLQVISNSYTTKKLKNNLKQFCMGCYVALSNIF